MATIDTFKAALKYGGYRPNQFTVNIIPPNIMEGRSSSISDVDILCRAASVPTCTIENAQTMYRGRQVNFAGERIYQPWTATFFFDNNYNSRQFFEYWSDGIRKWEETNGTILHENYYGTAIVRPLTRNDEILRSYKLVDVYPGDVGPIQLDYEANNQVSRFDVTFYYNYWTLEEGADISTLVNDAGRVNIGV